MKLKALVKQAETGLKKAAPDIMFFAGIALNAAAIVMFCKKSHETEPIVSKYVYDIEKAKEDHEDGITNDKQYRDLVIRKTVGTAKVAAKTYWLPALMWGTSVGLVTGSHYILKDRNAALAAIATGLGTELKTLHQRIIDKFGEEVDDELKFGTERKDIVTKSVDEETGEEIVHRSSVPVLDELYCASMYARYFDDKCRGFRNNPEYNLAWLIKREHEANDRLQEEGELLLNDVYDMLGMERSRAGGHVGWRAGWKTGPKGDGYISFGIHKTYNKDFVNLRSPIALLDFNCDGEILEGYPERDVYGKVIKKR